MRKKIAKLYYALFAFLSTVPAWAAEEGGGKAGLVALAGGIAIGLAAFGGALGQGRIGSSAMDGLARNPQARDAMFMPMILGLALIETLVIYALVVAILLFTKV